MRKHKKRGTRILSLVLTMAMVFTMLPSTALATEGEVDSGANGAVKSKRITLFNELGADYTKSVPFDGHTYALTVKQGTPIEEIKLPTELKVTVECTTTTSPAKDEVVDSGEAPSTSAPEDKPTEEAPPVDESTQAESVAEPTTQAADTETTVSDGEPTHKTHLADAPTEAPPSGQAN